MSLLFQTIKNTGKSQTLKKLIRSPISSCKCLLARNSSDVSRKFLSFDEVVLQRRDEARRSLVIQVNSESSFSELYGYCSNYATINGIHHYKNAGGEHFMLIEFNTEDSLKEILQSCSSHQKDNDIMALQSPFLWFRASPVKKDKLASSSSRLITKNGNAAIDEDMLFGELTNCATVSDQIQLLYDRTMLNDLGIRLRYMVARQLEIVFESLYANIAVRPFGSSVNGFGRMGCDLDLVLSNNLTDEMSDANKRLVYQDKKSEGGRGPWQRHMELVGELLELRVVGATRVQRILHARVPIVKYAHEFTDVDCDLCYNNMSGVYMSELLWMYGSLDPRVRPLAFLVRRWAAAVGLTNQHPGRWITNFPLTLMVLFFLQQKTSNGFILPSLKNLVNRARKQDMRIAEENVNCTFLRDMNILPQECYSQNQSNLETLLLQFFEYYAQFDFQEKAICINEGRPVRKPNALPLYIVNPLAPSLNVSRNVSYEECERLKSEVRNAAWQLEAGLEGERPDDWGVLGLIEKKASRGLKKLLRVGNSHRLVSVKDLFNDNDENISEGGLRSKLQRLTQTTAKEIKQVLANQNVEGKKDQKIKFKNNQVANEVYRIRRNKMV
ncbi:poly(A) RNA polymerase, mitochondrial-like [Achroia grisella]|uniref:poly(A) RNA polymerase, mitochondrial-like n=1 Tax=Achroia grisella TaxID=688607 RepID=UPI0027D31F45|nr:poly(A) RNA polymerase, mitochondrial-like [Achroia grisella]